MKKKVRCSNCGKLVDYICADCWRCESCCDCKEKTKKRINGRIVNEKQ